MPERPSSYHRPKSVEEALILLSKPDSVALAGGTALLAKGTTKAVVDIQDCGLDQITLFPEMLSLGAMVRLTDLGDFLSKSGDGDSSGEKSSLNSLLVKAIRLSGPNTYRNAATLGGIVASRLPDSELLAALLVLDTELMVYTPEQISINIVDYLASEHRPNGLISELKIPRQTGTGRSERVARTPADYPIVSVTYFRTDDGVSRLAATGIDRSPIRLEDAEEALNSGANIGVVAQAAKDRARHPGDFRGTSHYRAQMAYVLTRRVLSSSEE